MPQLPIVRADVEGYLGVTATTTEAPWLDDAAAAASSFAARHGLELDVLPTTVAPVDVPAEVRLGAVMLAGRWFTRRNSPTGVAAFGDLGPAYVRATDPDVAMLLGLNRPRIA